MGDHRNRGEVSGDADQAKLSAALALLTAFMVFELVVGLTAHSLALLDGGMPDGFPARPV